MRCVRSSSLISFLLVACYVYQVCGKPGDISSGLQQKYGESTHAYGVSSDGMLVEIRKSTVNNTWTIVRYDPKTGITCMISAGTDWTHAAQKHEQTNKRVPR